MALTIIFSGAAMALNLTIGSHGPDVVSLQKSLKFLGQYYSSMDGIFGPKTRAAVTAFQLKNGLVPDGIAGPLTMAAIAKLTAKEEATRILHSTPSGSTSTATTGTGTTGSGSSAGTVNKPAPGPVNIPVTSPSGKKEVLGYVEDLDPSSASSVANYSGYMTTIATFTYKVTPWGGLTGSTPYNTIKLAKSRGIRPLALIHNYNGSFDPALANSVLGLPDNRQNLINNLVTTVRDNGYAGVNIDIEGIYKSDRSNYVNFLRELKQAFAPYGFTVTVAIPAKDYDNQWNSWSNGYDYQGIGQVADQVVIMTYDENWGGTGPVASLPWVTRVVNYAVTQMPRNKILLGLATYGYDYPGGTSYGMRYMENTILPNWGGQANWNSQYNEPFYTYWRNGTQHTIWYEDERSNAFKLNLVNQYNLGGIAIWRLGYENQSFWNTVRSKIG